MIKAQNMKNQPPTTTLASNVNMYMRYYQKKLELEFSEGLYFERYLDLVNHKKPLDNYILQMAFTDWSITSQVERTKRHLEQKEKQKEKVKR